MDPTACLRRIDLPVRINADTQYAMLDLHTWLLGKGFSPDWARYPRGTRRFRRKFGTWPGMTSRGAVAK